MKETIQVMLDWGVAPIYMEKCDDNGREITGIKVIDNDEVIQSLIDEIGDLYFPLWTDSVGLDGTWHFDEKKEKELAPRLLELIRKLLNRLDDINDGSYEVWDMITEHLEKLSGEMK